jgi:uncharacterized membrane protein YhaH (DUF805 family)
MNAVNPYAPPRTAVRDVEADDPGVQPVRMWSAQGRIGRLRYLAHMAGAYVLLTVAGFLGGFLAAATRSKALEIIVLALAVGAYFVFLVLKTIQRSHDMDWSGWTSLLALIPFVGLIWVFKGGARGANSYGPPSPPNTLGVKVLGLLFPVVAGIGIVAAIALPAYVAYSKAGRTVQTR